MTIARSERKLIGHVAIETVSVLSRMPRGQRVAAPVVLAALRMSFPDEWLTLGGEALRSALDDIAAAGISGGALYDALIAMTALSAGASLVSADRRAVATYERLGISYSVFD